MPIQPSNGRGNEVLLATLEHAEEILIPVTVLGELNAGFQLGSLLDTNLKELSAFLHTQGGSMIEITDRIAMRYGSLVKTLRSQGTPIPTNAIWIAASVMDTGSILLTADHHIHTIPGLLAMGFPYSGSVFCKSQPQCRNIPALLTSKHYLRNLPAAPCSDSIF